MGQVTTVPDAHGESIVPPPVPQPHADGNDLRERVSTLESRMAECQGQAAAVVLELRDHTDLRWRVHRLKEWRKQLISELAADRTLRDSVVEQSAAARQQLNLRLSEVETSLEALRTDIASQKADLVAISEDGKGVVGRTKEPEELISRLDEIERRIRTDRATEAHMVEDQINAKFSRLEGLVQTMTTPLRAPNAGGHDAGQEISGRFASLESMVARVRASVEDVQSGQDHLKHRLDGLESDVRGLRTGIDQGISNLQQKVLEALHDQSRTLRLDMDAHNRALRLCMGNIGNAALPSGWDMSGNQFGVQNDGSDLWMGSTDPPGRHAPQIMGTTMRTGESTSATNSCQSFPTTASSTRVSVYSPELDNIQQHPLTAVQPSASAQTETFGPMMMDLMGAANDFARTANAHPNNVTNVRTDIVHSNPGRPNVAHPNLAHPGIAHPDVARPNVAHPREGSSTDAYPKPPNGSPGVSVPLVGAPAGVPAPPPVNLESLSSPSHANLHQSEFTSSVSTPLTTSPDPDNPDNL